MATTEYGDISPRTAAYVQRDLLERGLPYLLLERVAQGRPVPARNSKQTTFRRYNALDSTPSALTEGVTPSAKQLTKTDITATLTQYGDLVTLSDVVLDTHEDPVLQEAVDILGEQAGQMIEKVRFGVAKAGSNVFYANGAARNQVNTPISLAVQRKITRALRRQMATPLTRVGKTGVNYGQQAIAPAFIAIAHTDLENDIRDMPGFKDVIDYSGSVQPIEGEIGSVEKVRYLCSPIYDPWADAGAAYAGSGTDMISTTGVNADVYPVMYFGTNAFATIPLKGKAALTPMVVNPKPSDSDPLAQRGHVSWKAMMTSAILNDLWMARLECAVKA